MGRTPVSSAKRNYLRNRLVFRRPSPESFTSTSADELFGRDLNGIERRTDHHKPAVRPGASISSDIAFELGAVARITRAPPRLCNSSAAFFVLLSM